MRLYAYSVNEILLLGGVETGDYLLCQDVVLCPSDWIILDVLNKLERNKGIVAEA